MEDYSYKLSVFEGPLDLLLHLIENHKIEIYDIPIVEITSQYMEYLDNWNHFDIHYSSEFLVMASTLLQIKSRMLLPKASPVTEDEEDPRDELVAKLVEFKKIKEFTELIYEKTSLDTTLFSRPEETSVLGLDRYYELDISHLYQVFANTFKRVLKEQETPITQVKVEKDPYSLEDMMIHLFSRARRGESMFFSQLLMEIGDKSGMVTVFMAVLELLKQQTLFITDIDDDIILSAQVDEPLQEELDEY